MGSWSHALDDFVPNRKFHIYYDEMQAIGSHDNLRRLWIEEAERRGITEEIAS